MLAALEVRVVVLCSHSTVDKKKRVLHQTMKGFSSEDPKNPHRNELKDDIISFSFSV